MKKVLIIAILIFVFVSIFTIVFTTQIINTFTEFDDNSDDGDDDFTSNGQISFDFIRNIKKYIRMGLFESHHGFPITYEKCYSLFESFTPIFEINCLN
jgi:hypothetical protein